MTQDEHKVILGLIFASFLLFFIFRWMGFPIIGALLAFGSLLELKLVGRLARGWRTFVGFIGHILSSFVLGFIYYFFVTPYGWMYRMVEPDLTRKFRSTAKQQSYYHKIDKPFTKEQFEKTW